VHITPVSSYPVAQEHSEEPTPLDVISGHDSQVEFPFVGLNVPAVQAEGYIYMELHFMNTYQCKALHFVLHNQLHIHKLLQGSHRH